jgi:hypothetical protein
MIDEVNAWIAEIDQATNRANELRQWGKFDRLQEERRTLEHTLAQLGEFMRSRVVLPDGRTIRGRMTVVIDEAAEERHERESRARVIEQYGSEEAYERHCLAEARRIREEIHAHNTRVWFERAQSTRRAQGAPRPASRDGQRSTARRASYGQLVDEVVCAPRLRIGR